MNSAQRSLLVRADFVVGRNQQPDSALCRRWRRVFIQALPKLMGCADRVPVAERVSLHTGTTLGSFTGWLRIPMPRKPNRKALGKLKRKLRDRLESSLSLMDGTVLKLGVRRCTGWQNDRNLFSFMSPGTAETLHAHSEPQFELIEQIDKSQHSTGAVADGPSSVMYPQPA
jgi:hypothetical protein